MTAQNITRWIPLKTRAFTCFFETGTGYLRRVKFAGAEVVRALYGAVRDKNWNTVEPRLSVERLEQDEGGFWLEFTAHCDQPPISFLWKGSIQGQGGLLKFHFDGQAGSPFLRNRIGLCVLHPIVECAGKSCRTQRTDGTWQGGQFPLHISPHQPFKDLRALSWRPSHRMQAEIRFEGDVFEMQCALFLNDSAEQCLLAFRQAIESGAVDTCLVFHEAEKSTSSRWFELPLSLDRGRAQIALGPNAWVKLEF